MVLSIFQTQPLWTESWVCWDTSNYRETQLLFVYFHEHYQEAIWSNREWFQQLHLPHTRVNTSQCLSQSYFQSLLEAEEYNVVYNKDTLDWLPSNNNFRKEELQLIIWTRLCTIRPTNQLVLLVVGPTSESKNCRQVLPMILGILY